MASDNAKKHFDRGLAFFHRGEHDKAADLFQKALMEEPDYMEALYNLASCQAALGVEDDALIYLDRASKLNPQCLSWAKEDSEFDELRNDQRFKRIFEANDILDTPPPQPEVLHEDEPEPEQEDPPPKFLDGTESAPHSAQTSGLPPCLQCGGILEVERVLAYPLPLSLALVTAGVVLSVSFLDWTAIVVGIPLVIGGLYFFIQTKAEWHCLVCGAKGKNAGQPKDWKQTELP